MHLRELVGSKDAVEELLQIHLHYPAVGETLAVVQPISPDL
jgi:hypothetical protein